MKKRIDVSLFIPLLVFLFFALLNLVPFYKTGDLFFYDLFLRLSPGPKEDQHILLLDIDDLAIANVGMFPWSRDIMADGLVLLKELGARYAVFDIEYTEKSALGVNSDYLKKEVPLLLNKEFESMNSNIRELFEALVSGTISLKDARDYVDQLEDLNTEVKQELLQAIQKVTRDNDTYFADAATFFGNAVFTVNLLKLKETEYSKDNKTWVLENRSIPITILSGAKPVKATDIRPAVEPLARASKSIGFTNVHIDPDGVRRRIPLIAEVDGTYLPQLSFAAIYDLLGRPELFLSSSHLTLKNAHLPKGTIKTISIPLDSEGYFIINWPRAEFEKSFSHLSYYTLILHQKQERMLLENLRIMEEAGYLNYYTGESPLLSLADYVTTTRNEAMEKGDPSLVNTYVEAKEYFLSEVGSFLNGTARDTIIQKIDALLASDTIPVEQKQAYREIRQSVQSAFTNTKELYDSLLNIRSTLKSHVQDAICYIGWTGTATTDRGINPFDTSYDNVGTHGAIANTILNERYIDEVPLWVAIIVSLPLALLYYVLKQRLQPGASILLGIAFILVILGGALLYFNITGIYFKVFTPILVMTISFIGLTSYQFLSTSREKNYIRDAFGQYLSDRVVEELLQHPEKLNLGGEKRYMTAMFTDVKGFSTISETMDPADLVKLLNRYLTTMSDIIMENEGTIDKYEGDAIIAFFGAPTDVPDHARRACLSAIQMKRAERELNLLIEQEKLSPYPLLTRVGINTGDMVVGNMGTNKKKDYTMMGNAVNLAARLEGVNKRYGSWILISEETYKEGGKFFATRMFDQVRVVGINTPVRLYQLVEEWDRIDEKTKNILELSQEGLLLMEGRNYQKAIACFEKILSIDETDAPAMVFLARAKEYLKNPPPDSWDGVYKLTEK